jgi:hypothetical protein
MLSYYDVVIFLVDRNAPVNSSVAFEAPGTATPPKPNPIVCVPAPPKNLLAVVIAVLAVQFDPLYSSVSFLLVFPGGVTPPKPKAAVCVPIPASNLLAVFKLPPAVHEVPSYSSVTAVIAVSEPPNPKAAVCIPAPANSLLVVPRFPPPVQVLPSYSSVAFVTPGAAIPPNPSPAV